MPKAIILAAFATAVPLLAACGDSPRATVPTPTTLPDEGTEALIDDMVNMGGVSAGAVLLSRGEDVLFSKAYGMADRKNGIANTPRTVFAVGGFGAVAQPFTAAAVLQLEEKGLLDVNEPVETYLPDHAIDPRITIHHLLTNTSGVSDLDAVSLSDAFHNDEIIQQAEEAFPKPIGELVNLFKDEPMEFTPGDRYGASAWNYLLLRLLIEETSGQALEDYLADHFFKPLGMADTRFCDSDARSNRRAIGYETPKSETPAKDWEWLPLTTGPHGTGLLCTSVEDLYLWAQGLRLGKVINEDSVAAMFTPYVEVEPVGSIGYGWWIGGPNTSEDGRRRHGVINGFGPGTSAHARWYPAEETFVVMLSNSPPAYEVGHLWGITNIVVELAFEADGR